MSHMSHKKSVLFDLRYWKKLFVTVGVLSILSSCISTKRNLTSEKETGPMPARDFDHHFTGILVFDPVTKDTLFSKNASKYFTPASTTKIFTLYTGLKLIPEKIPALTYMQKNDTLFVAGTGDPSLLHPYFKDSTALHFLKGQSIPLAVHFDNYQGNSFGPGWAWEDYDQYFSPERSSLPLYGNTVQLHASGTIPSFFKKDVTEKKSTINRALRQNHFYFDPAEKDTVFVPFITKPSHVKGLLETALDRKVTEIHAMPKGKKNVLFGIPSDSLYRRMMHQSDNFIAEQLLLLASSSLSDTLSSSKPRNYILKNQLSDLGQVPRWVDGSGLSRYNLFSPESMVQVLYKLYIDLPLDRLLNLFPAGGVSGTLKESFSGQQGPYIYAKSGSLGNNYCLSGYLITKSNKILIFSFMNNHYRRSTTEIKQQMQSFFQQIRNHY